MGVSGIDAGGYVCISSRGAPLPLDLELYSRAAQVANSISIGLQLDAEVRGADVSMYKMLERVFFTLCALELLARFVTAGCACLRNPWVKFLVERFDIEPYSDFSAK